MQEFKEFFLPPLLFIGGIIIIVLLAIFPIYWYSASQQANILNKTYGTNYSTKDLFWAKNTVKEIIQGKTHNIIIKEKK